MAHGANCWLERTTRSNNGIPAKGCNTFGKSEHIRVPLPAARIIMSNASKVPPVNAASYAAMHLTYATVLRLLLIPSRHENNRFLLFGPPVVARLLLWLPLLPLHLSLLHESRYLPRQWPFLAAPLTYHQKYKTNALPHSTRPHATAQVSNESRAAYGLRKYPNHPSCHPHSTKPLHP